MGKGFDTFMRNPYWKRWYDNAPSEELKRYYEISFDTSPFVPGSDYGNKELDQKCSEVCRKLSREDIDYLYRQACEAQDGKLMSYYRQRLERLEQQEKAL